MVSAAGTTTASRRLTAQNKAEIQGLTCLALSDPKATVPVSAGALGGQFQGSDFCAGSDTPHRGHVVNVFGHQ
jgi:hypothetical protein